ncbi:PadR family transcriptional regulator [Nocardiopsis flavescens]
MSLRHAILGILSVKPMSGYELKKVVDGSVGHFWTADRSQIYRTLSALVEEGLASRGTVVQEGRPTLHPHTVTDAGLAELDRWLASPLQAPPTRDAFLARLFFADRLPPERVRALLDARHREVAEELAELEAIEFPPRNALPEGVTELGYALREAARDHGLAHARAELAWIDATRRRLERITP